ncbi:MAG: DUF1573 domain-containing protein [Flavobacteriales bacterium]
MKKFISSIGLLFVGLLLAGNVNAQAVKGAVITFDKDEHNYGNIKQGGNGECEFKFTNTGTEPLIIQDAKGSCGCTVPEWPKGAIKPGESAVIKVKYDTKRVGPINKSVTVTSNAVNEGTKVLRIKGTVEAVEGGGAPVRTTEGGTPINN